MLIGYVSDEKYVALPDCLLEFNSAGGSWEARSRATGAVHVDLPLGEYRVRQGRLVGTGEVSDAGRTDDCCSFGDRLTRMVNLVICSSPHLVISILAIQLPNR